MSVLAAPAAARLGRTTIQPRALRRITQATVAELAGVSPNDVTVELTGADGVLTVTVATALDRRAAQVTGTLIERAVGISADLARRLESIADRKAGRIHIRFTRLAGQDRERRVS